MLKKIMNKENKLPLIVLLAIISFFLFNILNKNFFKNMRFDLTKSNDPKEFAEKALSSLQKVKDDAIPHNNNTFKTTLRNIQAETKRITENPSFSTEG